MNRLKGKLKLIKKELKMYSNIYIYQGDYKLQHENISLTKEIQILKDVKNVNFLYLPLLY